MHPSSSAEVSGDDASVILSIFAGTPYPLPRRVELEERHPLGSQAFYPLGQHDWLIIFCSDEDGIPTDPKALLASSIQGINLKPNVWHGVLTPLVEPSDFLVVDRGGHGQNLEEHELTGNEIFTVHLPD